MNGMKWRRGAWRNLGLLSAGVATALAIGSYGLARMPRENRGRADAAQSEKGVVERFTTAPRGEIDGAVLAGGATVHWPPHVGERVRQFVATGDRIEVVGNRETTPEGINVLEAQSIENLRSGDSLEVADYPPGQPGPGPRAGRGRGAAGERTVKGEIRSFTTAPRGEIDGAVLADGTVIHWPPHLAGQYTALADQGDRVRATGGWETGPAGDTHFEVTSLTNLENRDDDGGPAKTREERGSRSELQRRLERLEDRVAELARQVEQLRRER